MRKTSITEYTTTGDSKCGLFGCSSGNNKCDEFGCTSN